MVVLSVLRGAAQFTKRAAPPSLWRLSCGKLQNGQLSVTLKRFAHGKTMEIKPSRYEWEKWKDQTNFYFVLGLIPVAAIIAYTNIYIGPAELTDIPEGYEPKHWEYHQNPIKRWFSRYLYDPPQKNYEKMLHLLNDEQQKAKYFLLEKKVTKLMAEKEDYKGWYFQPVHERQAMVARQGEQQAAMDSGTKK